LIFCVGARSKQPFFERNAVFEVGCPTCRANETPCMTDNKQCVLFFEEYIPSPVEQRWLSSIEAWKDTPLCSHFDEDGHLFKQMYDYTTAKTEQAQKRSLDTVLLPPDAELIFSKFKRRYKCADSSNPLHGKERIDIIEPLAGGLRDMRCFPQCMAHMKGATPDGMCSRNFMLPLDLPPGTGNKVQVFDFGASTFGGGSCGASQPWMVENYRGRGFNITNLQLWELGPTEPSARFAEVPAHVIPIYQYFHIGVSGELDSKFNPWNNVKARKGMSDYTVVKLDIDGGPEELLMSQLLLDPTVDGSLITEMYFEHHTTMVEMLDQWWNKKPPVGLSSIADTYKIFLGMRRKGIRMHGWP
jgi:hypothetical protein